MWAATNWHNEENVIAQRKQVLDCLQSLLTEYCKQNDALNAMDAYSTLKTACNIAHETTADMVVKLWSHAGITELDGRELCSILGEVIREDDARTPVQERPSKLFESAVTLVCMLQARAVLPKGPTGHQPMTSN